MSNTEIGTRKEQGRSRLFKFLGAVLSVIGSYYLIDFMYLLFIKQSTDLAELGRGICFLAVGIFSYLKPSIFVSKKGNP